MVDSTRSLSRLGVCVLAGMLLAAPSVRATTFGDIDVVVESEPKGNSWHGYLEYTFLVTNRSTDRSHTVGLSLPHEKSRTREDTIRALRRTVSVGANETVRVVLLQPDHPPIFGSDLTVTIDNQRGEHEVPLRPNQTHRSSGYSGSRGYSSSSLTVVADLLVLMSRSIRKNFPVSVPAPPPVFGPGGMGGMTIGPAGGMAGMAGMRGAPPPSRPPPIREGVPAPKAVPTKPEIGISPHTQLLRADMPVEAWSSNWLAYSRYDGVVVTGDDMKAMPAAVRSALWQYVETGGTLLVLGRADLRGLSGVGPETAKNGWQVVDAGFGRCLLSPDDKIDEWDTARYSMLDTSWTETARPWLVRRSSYDANEKFPVVDDIGIPVKGLFVLMLVFTVTIGPVNFLLLGRWKRRIWLLWTTPLLSLLTCLAVFGYMLLSEGWRGTLRSDTFTVLDESSHRATTIGWTAVYSPLTPGDGLHFSYETEVIPQRMHEGRRAGIRPCTIDLSQDQHFASGWVEARVPAHFKVRKSEVRRERVAIHREDDGKVSAVNGLGVEIRRLWYADEKGQVFAAAQIAPGARSILSPKNEELPPLRTETPRALLLNENWAIAMQTMTQAPLRRMRPRSYLAEVDDSPFLEDALRDAGTRKCHALVLGILQE